MQESPIKLKHILLSGLFAIIIVVKIFLNSFLDRSTKIVFCDVGQGDATYIRVANSIDILIDAGPQNQILNCLGKHMPFYDRQIELAILSHPQKDHYGGFIPVLERLHIQHFYLSRLSSDNQSFFLLIKTLKVQKTNIHYFNNNEKILVKKAVITFLGPKNVPSTIGNGNDNNLSLVFLFKLADKRILFTGDAGFSSINNLLDPVIIPLYILKIPHHGSKNGLDKKLLQLADPAISVISVGKNNSYGHPAKEVLDLLKASKTKIYRTDLMGDIVFKIPQP